jgi:glycolate oxidase iron-sulfur subunit
LQRTYDDSNATAIVSANIGCITHLQQEKMPVLHWVEIVDQLLEDAAPVTGSGVA